MTICRKCGNPIPDGEELCESCLAKEGSAGVDYFEQLAQMSASAASGMSAIEAVKAKAATRPKPAPKPEPEPEPVVEETIVEEPVIEETPVVEEPVVEEPIAEEPIIEETPVVEEPAIEETPVVEEPVDRNCDTQNNIPIAFRVCSLDCAQWSSPVLITNALSFLRIASTMFSTIQNVAICFWCLESLRL